jgi:LysM repeat protein
MDGVEQKASGQGAGAFLKRHRKRLLSLLVPALLVLMVVGVLLSSPKPRDTTHTVVAGETVARICMLHQISVSEVLKANPGLDPRRLRVGQPIIIPRTPTLIKFARKLDRILSQSGMSSPPFERAAKWLTE